MAGSFGYFLFGIAGFTMYILFLSAFIDPATAIIIVLSIGVVFYFFKSKIFPEPVDDD